MRFNNIILGFALLIACMNLISCQDIVTYDDGYDDGMTSTGAPVIDGIYGVEDREMQSPISEASLEDMIVLKGSNLSNVKKVMLNDVEVPIKGIYATASEAYFQIPFEIPEEVNNKLYYETALGNTSCDFSVKYPPLQVAGLYNEFAFPGESVKVEGSYFELYGFGNDNSTASISINGEKVEVDSISQNYMSIIIPENAVPNSKIEFSYGSDGDRQTISIPYRSTETVLWNLSNPDQYGLWAGNELITDGLTDGGPLALNGPYFRVKGSYSAWSWNNLPCGVCSISAEIAANPFDYWFKFEVNSASGTPFYDAPTAGYIIQLNGGNYIWNPGSFNTYGEWYTVRVDLAEVATNGLSDGQNNLFWIMQPTSDWNVDHSFANVRIEKKN